jgi:uncharacterized membrane protein YeaQ/YmgE (transglycosylase-associated protein family)
MANLLKKTIVILLIVGILAPSFYLVIDRFNPPAKAEAQTNCVAGLFGAALGGVISGAAGAVISVPVQDASNLIQNTGTNASSFGSFVKDCIITPLLERLIMSLIQRFTADLVTWIESGFEGEPSFVSNPGRFLQNSADLAVGGLIEEIAPWLCDSITPFVIPALAFRFSVSYHYQEELGCRLSDVIDNLQDFLSGTKGSFTWDNWAKLTTIPQNNAYGAYFGATAIIDQRVEKLLNLKKEQLNYGRGFLSSEICYATNSSSGQREKLVLPDSKNFPNPDDFKKALTEHKLKVNRARELGNCEIKTPGSVIQDTLSNALGADLQRYNVAQSFDAIIGALMDLMIGRVREKLFSRGSDDISGEAYLRNIRNINWQNRTAYMGTISSSTIGSIETSFNRNVETEARLFADQQASSAYGIASQLNAEAIRALQQKTLNLMARGAQASFCSGDAWDGTSLIYAAKNALDNQPSTLAISQFHAYIYRDGTVPTRFVLDLKKSEYIRKVRVFSQEGEIRVKDDTRDCKYYPSPNNIYLLAGEVDNNQICPSWNNNDTRFYPSIPDLKGQTTTSNGTVITAKQLTDTRSTTKEFQFNTPTLARTIVLENTNTDNSYRLCIQDVSVEVWLRPTLEINPSFLNITGNDAIDPFSGVKLTNNNGEVDPSTGELPTICGGNSDKCTADNVLYSVSYSVHQESGAQITPTLNSDGTFKLAPGNYYIEYVGTQKFAGSTVELQSDRVRRMIRVSAPPSSDSSPPGVGNPPPSPTP